MSKALDGLNFVTGGSFKDIIFSVVLSGTQEILMKWQKWKTAKPCPASLKIFNVFSRSVLLTEVTRTRWMENIVCISWEVLQNIRKIFIPTFYFEKYEKAKLFSQCKYFKKSNCNEKVMKFHVNLSNNNQTILILTAWESSLHPWKSFLVY